MFSSEVMELNGQWSIAMLDYQRVNMGFPITRSSQDARVSIKVLDIAARAGSHVLFTGPKGSGGSKHSKAQNSPLMHRGDMFMGKFISQGHPFLLVSGLSD